MTICRHQSARHRAVLFAGLATAALLAASSAEAESATAIHLSAGPMDTALLDLAAQTHEQLVFSPALVAGLRAAPLRGTFTVEDALARLLAGTRVVATRTGPSTLVLKAGGAAAATPVKLGSEGRAASPFGGEPPAASPLALSERQADPVATAPVTTVEAIEVTGTHIRGAVSPSPLLVISRDDLVRTGRSTVAAALQALPQNFGGGASEGTSNTGADTVSRNQTFANAVNLRGLGNNATLVLVNGRRLAGSGTFGDFTDISAIPTSAVERVEVLLDGASAIYGSDAVAGVINIILRKTFSGAEARLEAGAATEGAPQEGQFALTLGKRWESGGVLLSYEGQLRGALPSADRRYTASADLRPLGGTDQRVTNSFPGNILNSDFAPGWAIPAGQNGVGLAASSLRAGVVNLQNQLQGVDILPDQNVQSLYLAADQALGDRLQLSADARYSNRRYQAQLAAATSTIFVTTANPFFVSPTGDTSEFVAYNFAGDLPNSVERGSVETFTGTFGGTLRLGGDWQGDGYLTFAQETEEDETTGIVNSTALSEAVGSVADRPQTAFLATRDGFFNPFSGIPGSNAPAVLDYISDGFTRSESRDQVYSANLQADGSIWTLPAGALKLAVGLQARRETLVRSGSNFTSTVAPTPQAGTDLARTVTAAFAEVRAPIFGASNAVPGFQKLELSLAGRIEHYSDAGTTSNPKVGVLWQPIGDVTLRATYGTSFRAPALREIADPALNSESLFPLGTARVRSILLNGGNPTLRPETAETWTAGLDYRPVRWPGLDLSFTGFDIRFSERIGQPVLANLAGALTDPTLASFVTRVSPGTNPADLALVNALLASPAASRIAGLFPASAYGAVVDNRYVNTTTLHVRGFDLIAAYAFDVGGDRISLTGNGTYLSDYDQQITPTSATVNDIGIAGFPVRFRGRAMAEWTRDRVTAGLAFNYISAYRDLFGVKIADQPTFDAQLRLAPAESGIAKALAVTLNIRNLFDRAPPFYNNLAGVAYDPTNADPIGRFVSVQFTRVW
jgi:outer membrane receptor protein involved in Fe transport